MKGENSTASDSTISTLTYHITALPITIYFNKEGDHDHNGLIFALSENVPILKYIRALARADLTQAVGGHGGHDDTPEEWYKQAKERAEKIGVSLPSTPEEARQPHPLVRPLVLRVRKSDRLQVELHNEVSGRHVGLHLVGDGYDVKTDDGSHVGKNDSSLTPPDGRRIYTWICDHEGVFPFHDAGNLSGGEDGTNVHGLFGALVVEPPEAQWTDPVTGELLQDGLYADVHPQGLAHANSRTKPDPNAEPCDYPDEDASFREYVIFFHDEPEFQPAHEPVEPNPCPEEIHGGHGDTFGQHRHGGSEHEGMLPIMPISYRSEPMVNRERKLWRMIREGRLKKPVIGEEQHHSSWLFGDPATPILQAYVGDPIRIRLVHAAVKETHVFHQHVYQWHAEPRNRNSPIIDSISITPHTGHTIELLYGAGSSQGAIGDAIFHCHLYPHFHEGMWGILRTFDRLQDGTSKYPDHREDRPHLIDKLMPLPDRHPLEEPISTKPGWPAFMMSQAPGDGAGEFGQKSPLPPWPEDLPGFGPMDAELDYRLPTALERAHFNNSPKPGALFNIHPFPKNLEQEDKVVKRDLAVILTPIVYNDDQWHDPHGHTFILANDATAEQGGEIEPLVVRGHQHTVVQTTLDNRLPAEIPGTAFDLPFPPCDFFPTPLAECGLHVHLVKFDPLVSDGASVGWNYITGPQVGKKMIYRWHVDEEFGTVFFHDHLFANFRQKHGLFGAFIAEPPESEFLDPYTHEPIQSGLEAAIVPRGSGANSFTPFREFCFAVADFIPLFDRRGEPLNPPEQRGGHGDQGVMAVNYRCEPIRERGGDPAFWFLSRRHEYKLSERVTNQRRLARVHHGDPSTNVFETHAGDPIRIRLLQGSHEEQHSFQIHGMRWQQFLRDPHSRWRNQQTLGISEAFSFEIDQRYNPGDRLWKFGAADDLWLGCWGLIRAYPRGTGFLLPLPLSSSDEDAATAAATLPTPPDEKDFRRFKVVAEQRPVVYREPDLIDPFGLVYRLEAFANPGADDWIQLHVPSWYDALEPLILRCRQGEWVQVELRNDLPLGLRPEPFAPLVPVEDRDRLVSSRVSIHADLLRYDVRHHDGTNAGLNPIQTVEPKATRYYRWYADEEVGPVLLQDMADFRNHRHHGLIGALIVEPNNVTPVSHQAPQTEQWFGSQVTLRPYSDTSARQGSPSTTERSLPREEVVLILQDGLRLFFHGVTAFPIPDVPDLIDDPGGDRPDVEDQGQKGFNYRSEPTGGPRWLNVDNPATPVFVVPATAQVDFHLIVGADKPRNHSFTIHGHTWIAKHMSEAGRRVGAVSALSTGWVETLELETPCLPKDQSYSDYAYRTGVLKWALVQGLWGILRTQQIEDTRTLARQTKKAAKRKAKT